jgi:small conductance mechanosensitive channel
MGSIGQRLETAFSKMLQGAIKKVPDLALALLLIGLFFLFALILRRAASAALRRAGVHQSIETLVTRLVYYSIITIGAIEALGQVGISLTALGAGLGVAGIALGFALRDILSNFLSGILILWTRHFAVGDQIRIKDYEGTVVAIELRGTIMRTYDGRRVTIPNSEVYTNPVVNNTFYVNRRSSIFLTLGYDADLNRAEEIIRTALADVQQVIQDPQPDVLVKEFGNYAVGVEVRIWTPAQQIEVLTVNSAAAKAIKTALESQGFGIVTPTQIEIVSEQTSDQKAH